MQTSETINELAAALSKAQGEITGALKDSANPFFKSKYADLASCWDACRGPLSKNGLSVIQIPEHDNQGICIGLTTTLAHSSGQWMRGTLQVKPKDDTPQAMGSALTYARRYALTAVVGIAQVDDDGNAASGRANGNGQAYAESHKPAGDIPKSVDPNAAEAASNAMHATLHEGDLEEKIRALRVMDLHDKLNATQDVYIAAADRLGSKDRSAWKAYLAMAKKAESQEPTGKRF